MKTLKVYQNKLIETFISGAILLFFTPSVGNACERKKTVFFLFYFYGIDINATANGNHYVTSSLKPN